MGVCVGKGETLELLVVAAAPGAADC